MAAVKEPWETARLLCGVDEVGRGCLAGPVVAAAVVLPPGVHLDGVRDSKKLSQKKRESFAASIHEAALAVGFGLVPAERIDAIGIRPATHEAMEMAVDAVLQSGVRPDLIAIDYETIRTELPQVSVLHGDDRVHAIACASIVAKVYRDSLASQWDEQHPGYEFARHKGYGTVRHRDAIRRQGLSPLHRKTFCRKELERK